MARWISANNAEPSDLVMGTGRRLFSPVVAYFRRIRVKPEGAVVFDDMQTSLASVAPGFLIRRLVGNCNREVPDSTKRSRKHFFFEKKKQKTFNSLGALVETDDLSEHKFFSQKSMLSCAVPYGLSRASRLLDLVK
jgi:hypothetical protein